MRLEFSLLVLVCLCGAIPGVFASPFSYPSDDINFNWQSATNGILLDTNEDGIGDTLYTRSGTLPHVTLTKVFGTGQTPLNFGLPLATLSSTSITKTTIWFNTATTGPANQCNIAHTFVNILTGTKGNATTLTYTTGGDNAQSPDSFAMNLTDGSVLRGGSCRTAGGAESSSIVNFAGTVVQSCSNYPQAGSHWWNPVVMACGNNNFNSGGLYTFSKKNSTLAGVTGAGFGSGIDSVRGFLYNRTDTNKLAKLNFASSALSTTAAISPSVRVWNDGFELQHGYVTMTPAYAPTTALWKDLFSSTITDNQTATLLAHYRIFGETSSPNRFLLTDGVTQYVGIASATAIKYTSVDLTSRAMQYYMPDNNTPVMSTLAFNTQLPTLTYNIEMPTSTADGSQSGAFVLYSGYKVQIPGVVRSFDSRWTNNLTLKPIFIPPTSGLTSLSVLVRNAPTDAAVDVQSISNSLYGQFFSWQVKELSADDSFTVDLPTSLCVNLRLTTIDTATILYTDLGQLCASGTMPKTITYTTNLSFTFWSLPWGTSHLYDSDTNTIETLVRHSSTPYNYNVLIEDRNGTDILNNSYTTNSTLDTHLFNVTGVQTPIKLTISDGNNATLYFANMGTPNWTGAVVSFSQQYLTIDGFNLLFLMPLIFGAMFTRNTVSMGTVITVVFIATLVWVGVIPVPEVVVYLMFFVAAIGMIAYKIYNG